MSSVSASLEYVRNTNGGATREIFIEDHEPIGHFLWMEIMSRGFVKIGINGEIFLSEKGDEELKK